MKKIVIASLVLSVLCIGIYTNTADAAAAKKPLKGQIVSLDDIIKAKTNLQLTKAQAKELYEAGSPLVFLYNKKVYFVKNEDGSFAFKKLADYAHNKNVGIIGTTKTVKGINYIIMSNIESMD